MKKYLFIAIGGALGAILRYYIKNININNFRGAFPSNTFIINITGSLIIAIVLTLAYEIRAFDENIRLGIATGFLGAYTTFSTMCRETVQLFQKGMYFSSVLYILLSSAVGIIFAYLGVNFARYIVSKIIKKDDEEEQPENSEVS